MINYIRQILRGIILDLLGTFAKPAWGVHIFNGHRIAIKDPKPEVFRSQLKQINKYARFIRFEEAVELIKNRVQVNEVLIAFSFDDGFEECYTQIAPVLEEFKTNAAFFINPNFVDGDESYINHFTTNIVKTPLKMPMSWEQIIELEKRGHIIGAHTLDHHNINDNNIEELDRQVGDCKTVIEEHLNVPCIYFAFPFGRLEHANSVSIEIASKYYPYIFSQSDYKHYYSYDGRVINRRHFEPDWKVKHVIYFLSSNKKY